jgi:type II secretory pathway pseudopilin PulG
MAVLVSVVVPVWRTTIQREREAELVFRGEQYARAIALYQRQFANASPKDLDVLVEQKFLRKRYRDPMVPDGEFMTVLAGSDTVETLESQIDVGVRDSVRTQMGDNALGGIIGVTSRSTHESVRQYNGARRYNEWVFLASQFRQKAGPSEVGGESVRD